MPNDVKAIVSALAAVLAYWSGSPIRPEFSTSIMVTAVFTVVAMWIFPRLSQRSAMRRIDKSRMRVLIFCHQQTATSDLDALKCQS
jgi:hypothetical protein